jgi:hypothetical protein
MYTEALSTKHSGRASNCRNMTEPSRVKPEEPEQMGVRRGEFTQSYITEIPLRPAMGIRTNEGNSRNLGEGLQREGSKQRV